jgi:hypothetical protein
MSTGVSTPAGLKQEIVPAATDLVSIDVCLQGWTGASAFPINIRTGSVAAPGAIVATGTGLSPGPGVWQYVHIELAATLATVPGAMLVIEIPGPMPFFWMGAIFTGPDLYPPGTSSHSNNPDFGFRTYGSGAAPATNTPTPTNTASAPTATPTNTASAATATPTTTVSATATSVRRGSAANTSTPSHTATAPVNTTLAASATPTRAPAQPISPAGGIAPVGVSPPDTGFGTPSGHRVSPVALVLLAFGGAMIASGAVVAARRRFVR